MNHSNFLMTSSQTLPSDTDERYNLILSSTLIAGCIYTAAMLWQPYWYLTLGHNPLVSHNDYYRNALPHLTTYAVLTLPSLLIVCGLFFTSTLRQSLKDKWNVTVKILLTYLVFHISVILLFSYLFELYIDRTYRDSLLMMALLIKSKQFLAIALQGLVIVIIKPLIEGVVFRFGLMRWLYQKYPSKPFAVIVSSIFYSLLHINQLSASPVDIAEFAYVSFAGLLLGTVTVLRDWKIAIAIGMHIIANLVYFTISILAAKYSFGV